MYIIIDENYSRNKETGIAMLRKIIDTDNKIGYVPRIIFNNNLGGSEDNKNKIWNLLQQSEFIDKVLWELSFYEYIDESLIDDELTNSLLSTLSSLKHPISIYVDRFKAFLNIDTQIYSKILKILIDKIHIEGVRIHLLEDVFSKNIYHLSDNFENVKIAYIQQYLIQDDYDYLGKGMLEILKIDKNFLLEFVESLYSSTERHSLGGDHSDMSYVWNIDNIEDTLIPLFDLVIEKDLYFGILEHYCNVFFRNLKEEHELRADNFIRQYVIDNYNNNKKMQIVVDIIRNTRKELFEEIFLLFISLNQDKDTFGNLMWTGNGGTFSGDVIIGDIEASRWRNLLEIANKSDVGIKLIPIKNYINEQIESCLRSGDWERQRKFLSSPY